MPNSIFFTVNVTWQGVPVTGPLLIYHSEIQQTVNSNSLTCRHPTGPVAWYLPNGNILREPVNNGTFNNKITNERKQAQIMRGTDGGDERGLDGLWTCRLNNETGAGAFHVGIYDDTPTTGKITLKCFLSRLTSQKYTILFVSAVVIFVLCVI